GEGGSAASTPPPAAAQTLPPAGGESAPAKAAPPVSSPAGGGGPAGTGEGKSASSTPTGQRIFASPLARRLAEQAGVDIKALKGSGPHGRIIARDIDGAPKGAAAPKAATSAAASEPRQALSLEQMGIKPGSYDLIPLDNIRKISARRLTDSFRDIPHFPLTIDCEIDRLLEARTRINAALENEGVKVSVNDIVIKAAAVALKRVPEANASYTPDGIAMHHHADISMAVAIEGGLITPIVFEAETKGLAQIARETKDLAARARDRKLKPQEFQGGTFSVSNLGMFGVKDFSSIINEPQGAIMSVGAGEQRPVVKNGQLAVATVMSVTLTCDHRVVDGATGARFLQQFKLLVEDPVTMLA
ncbi:MAG: 2-oxo acid dehydrogenase subunit E2, partial [Caulobacteraceae bacterium]